MVAPARKNDADPDREELEEAAECAADPKKKRPVCFAETQKFFSDASPLREAEKHGGRPYEPRPQQTEMALEIARSLEAGENLCVEAPTGVGKSFAYLIPAIHAALSLKRPVIVTTETINLQEQLVGKDLPLLKKLTGLDFSFALAKGRSNYLCRRRLDLARGGHRDEFLTAPGFVPDVERLADWADKTEDGSRSSVNFRIDNDLWNCVCSEAVSCSGSQCRHFRSCFYWKARLSWDHADIVVANHALYFVDLKMRAMEHTDLSPLPEHCAVIFDEAHTLEDSAADHLGVTISSGGVRAFLNRLFNPLTGRGMLVKQGDSSLTLRGALAKAHEAAKEFFEQYSEVLSQRNDPLLRITKPGRFTDSLSSVLDRLAALLKDYASDLDDAEFKQEITAQLAVCETFRDNIDAFSEMTFDGYVYWAESRLSAVTKTPTTTLQASPLHVADLLKKIMFSGGRSVILTSATLAVNGDLGYYFRRTGFSGGSGILIDSPFDYGKQVTLYVPHNAMPLPNEEGYLEAVCDAIRKFVKKTEGRAFVLFTSYGMLRTCAEILDSPLRAGGIRLLVHGSDMTRSALLQEFRTSPGPAVLFGASSFWTGVDVPGKALSNVIITKLPFAVPTHPLIQARIEEIEERGGRPFDEYSIPDAVLKFRQGAGRLIRSKTDTGIIVILDRRIVSKYYGRRFLDSLPPCPVEYF